ncbi:hypothetical protein GCM10009792_05520 [Microcella alkalica]
MDDLARRARIDDGAPHARERHAQHGPDERIVIGDEDRGSGTSGGCHVLSVWRGLFA